MLKDLTKIKISGANFTEPTELAFFEPSYDKNQNEITTKGAFLYGRNGSGKSTIARAFKKLTGEEIPTISDVTVQDKDGHTFELTEEEKKHIFVFDEDFVDKNVRLQEDHLETIVMLGQEVDLSDKIKKAEEEEKAAREDMEAKEKEYKEYQTSENRKSPNFYIKKMRDNLQGDNNWAGRDRIINDARRNTAVSDNTYLQFLDANPQKTRDELLKDYYDGLERLNKAKNEASTIKEAVPSLQEDYLTYDDKEIQRLLAEKIEKPEFSEREKKILALVHECKTDEVNKRLGFLKDGESTECPYCFQPLSQEYKQSLISSYEKVLSKKVEEHQDSLQKHVIDEISIDLSPFSNLLGTDHYTDLIKTINKNIADNNKNLLEKKNHPYEPIIVNNKNINASLFQLKEDLMKLESARLSYNEEMKKTAPIRAELVRINKEIAYYDVIEDSKKHKEQEKKMEETKQLYNESITVWEQKTGIIENLNAQRRNIKLAVNYMNACMKYIFFAEDRLGIECENGVYKLRSHGKRVKPKDISVGERNIIGLSYFFTSILQGKEENDAYGEEFLLVIDDPVSSFDYENRVGILSFLRYILCRFLEGNRNTKALLMTHDIMTFFDFWKIFDEIRTNCNTLRETVNGREQVVYPNSTKINHFELAKNEISPFFPRRQEYTEIVKMIYEYASGQAVDEQHDLIIGNMMRQALEAYATFVYKKKIEDVSLDKDILNQLPEGYRPYYRNLMYRLVLHGGSHREEQVKAMQDFRFFGLISREEKVRTAKDILCFLFLLNRVHILKHLEGCKGNAKQTLTTWCNAINTGSTI